MPLIGTGQRSGARPARPTASPGSHAPRLRPGVRELLLLGLLYLAYSLVRVVASDDLGAALHHATDILQIEQALHLDIEHRLNGLLHAHHALEVGASFYYAAAHYLLTPLVLLWLWFRHPDHYRAARRALVGATVAALAVYVALPTAPPRLYGGYHDLLALTAEVGWWSTNASAPQGLGGLTNQLAAMPSMHVGWALWCALAIALSARTPAVRILAWLHPLLTTIVVIGTGNHWTLDAAAGVLIVLAAWTIARTSTRSTTATHRRKEDPHPSREEPITTSP